MSKLILIPKRFVRKHSRFEPLTKLFNEWFDELLRYIKYPLRRWSLAEKPMFLTNSAVQNKFIPKKFVNNSTINY